MKTQKTKVFLEMYGKHNTLAIWKVDDEGNKQGSFPIISFGKTKAEAIASHIDELIAFTQPTQEEVDL